MLAKNYEPAYIKTLAEGELQRRIDSALEILEHCTLCPRVCGLNRLEGGRGTCDSGRWVEVSSFSPHFGEERPLVGTHGSGTIFLTHCNLGCAFCQNYDISHSGRGREIPKQDLAKIMLSLQAQGCHNINFVSPSHFVPQILEALPIAIESGLNIPLVYNTGGYDAVETLRLLEGVFDIYMPDFKYTDSKTAEEYSQAADYPDRVREALLEMFRQVGDLELDENGIALRGLLVRHLVLPEGLAGTAAAMRFLAEKVSLQTYVNIMDQYYPCGDIPRRSPLGRRITQEEYNAAVAAAKEAGLIRLDKRDRPRLIW